MDKMIFYRDWMEALDVMPLGERCLVYEAIMNYAFEGIVPDDKYLNVVTALMRVKIDTDQKAYDEVCSMRAEAGKRGGLKSGESRRRNSKLNNPTGGDANAAADAVNAPEACGSNAKQGDSHSNNVKQTEANEANGSNVKQNEANQSNVKHGEADGSNLKHGEAKRGDEATIELKDAVDGLSSLCSNAENERELKLGRSDSEIGNGLIYSLMGQSDDVGLKQNEANEANGSKVKQNEHNSNSKYNCKYKYNDKEDKSSSSSSSTTARAREVAVAEGLKGSLEELKKSPVWKESTTKKKQSAGDGVDVKPDEFNREY